MKEVYENGDRIPGMPEILYIEWFNRYTNTGYTVRYFIHWDIDSEPVITFGEILRIAENKGYMDGTITLTADNLLEGVIYRYGNYKDEKWHIYGTTRGYA